MNLQLYYFEACPYCRKVLDFLAGTKLDRTIVKKDIRSVPEFRSELIEINDGNTQVPCLVIDGKPMLESSDIIDYLGGLS